MQNSLSFLTQVVTIALIAILIRSLTRAKGAPLPKTRNGTSVYRIKWQWRLFGLTAGLCCVAGLAWSWYDLHHPDGLITGLTVTFTAASIWLASGSITTNQAGITKKGLWRSLFFQWKDITEVRLHKKQGGAIELRSGAQKLVIDSRFNAFQHLLNEIEDHTQEKRRKDG